MSSKTIRRAMLPVALAACAMVSPADAGQRSGRLHVSVKVVDSCWSSSSRRAGEPQACAGTTVPIAVVRDEPGRAAAAGPQSSTPIGRVLDSSGLVTVIY